VQLEHGTNGIVLTTQAQRPGAWDATIATATLSPGSLQRMVRRRSHFYLSFQIPTLPSFASLPASVTLLRKESYSFCAMSSFCSFANF
jgi:hypothetical protein